ncbi:MAG: hypothetical protein VCB07_02625, partial [Gammaproteobacteria bacterium]
EMTAVTGCLRSYEGREKPTRKQTALMSRTSHLDICPKRLKFIDESQGTERPNSRLCTLVRLRYCLCQPRADHNV